MKKSIFCLLAWVAFSVWGRAATLFVDVNGTNPVSPYSSWGTAATNIQDAVTVAENDDTVKVADGHYYPSYAIQINKSITIQSENGADVTTVDGGGSHRCFGLNNSACSVRGFTLTQGLAHNSDGGAVYCASSSAIVEDCTITDSFATHRGGGMRGGTAINCTLSGNTANYGGGLYDVTATNCTLFGNSATSQGGGIYGGTTWNCLVSDNSSDYGGGIYEGTTWNSVISENTARLGGGTAQGTVHNSVICKNSGHLYGGGTYYTTANNCTVVGNDPEGSYRGTLNNCIIWENKSQDTQYGTIRNSCASDLPHGTNGNITNAPLLVSTSHIATNSPCMGTGDAAYASGTDIDGEAWENPPSMGCDEKTPGTTQSGEISFALLGPHFITPGLEADYFPLIIGDISWFEVDFSNGMAFTNEFNMSSSWSTAGSYSVIMTAYNADYPSGFSATQMVQVAAAEDVVVYVSPAGDDANDGSSWDEAKATIQAGVDAQNYMAGIVRVTNGVYLLTSEIIIDKKITLESVNGADATIVDGQGSCRGFNLGVFACVVRGFTVTNGYYNTNGGGGGIYCERSTVPLVENCKIVGNRADLGGGGMSFGTVSNCLISGNSTRSNSGGGLSQSTAIDCIISDNWSGSTAGGMGGGTAYNCRITGNSALNGGGGVYNGTLNNCVISGNYSGSVGGGMARGSATNCTFTGNTAAQEFGGIEYGKIYNCILFNNQPADTYYSAAFNSCAPGVTHGSDGNITNNPLLVSSSHIATNSPCRAAGDSGYATGVDIDGDAWQNPPSMGCDEKVAGETPSGSISLSLSGPLKIVAGRTGTYAPVVVGNVSGFSVDFGNGTVTTNTFFFDTSWPAAGTYAVVLSAYNDDYPSGVMTTQNVEVADMASVNVYVSTAGHDSNDGSSWAQAKKTVQAGVDAQEYEGGEVIIGDGLFSLSYSTITVRKNIQIRSLNGAEKTTIDGGGNSRCMDLGGSQCVISGLTLTDGFVYGLGAGVYCYDTTPVIEDCRIIDNHSTSSGGGVFAGTLNRCLIQGNVADNSGGGVCCSIVNNSLILGNTADGTGGGIRDGEANNCLISGNRSVEGGGGMMNGEANNCTFTGNTTGHVGGGIWSGTANNCILFANLPDDAYSVDGFNSCAPELMHGSNGNITNNPMLVSASHIATNSPCRAAGSSTYAIGTDIDGDAWQTPPSMGCDEKLPGETPSGDISLSLNGPDEVINNHSIQYAVLVLGNVSGFNVDFDNGTVATNQLMVSTLWPTAGSYDVVMTAYNADHPGGVTVTQVVTVVDAEDVVIHVSKTGNNSNDGSSWASAKATIQAGIDAQEYEGGTVRVGDGTYFPTATIQIKKNIVLESLNGAAGCIIDGGGVRSCLKLSGACLVSGFAITNGYGYYGGGVDCDWNHISVLEQCIITGNRARYSGGGLSYGRANDCILSHNEAPENNGNGGGSYNSILNHCRVIENAAEYNGGGSYGGVLNNCLVSGNSATNYAGGVYSAGLTNCTVVGNWSGAHFGGVYEVNACNSIIWSNTTAGTSQNGSTASLDYSCTTPVFGGEENIESDPQFVSGTDFRLQESSPCIDAANNSCMPFAYDLDGTLRPLDGDGDGSADVDMGCYEAITSIGDTDGDAMSDADEIIAGTGINDPDSFFLVDSISTGGSGTLLSWAAVTGRHYSVYWTDDLVHHDFSLRTNGLTSGPFLDTGIADGTNRFYLIRVELAP